MHATTEEHLNASLRLAASPKPHTPTALVIDQDLWTRVLLEKILTDEGYAVVVASNGYSGLRQARLVLPDVVLVELRASEMAGPAFVADLRRDRRTARIPVVMLAVDPDRASARDDATPIMRKPPVAEEVRHYLDALPRQPAKSQPLLIVARSSGQSSHGRTVVRAVAATP